MSSSQQHSCIFCAIILGHEPGTIRYEDDDVIVIDNRMRWTPVMMLAMSKKHLTQEELWADMAKVGAVALSIGEEHCPDGFRLVSNFGRDAMQSQGHGHIHILGGMYLGPYA